mmetsp:Transcript_84038/g.180153  ORF Transcript_84038/g.180153 Transcript_84038/m.180153 type:complete len:275 (-) Transcript_84038:109-933(-)
MDDADKLVADHVVAQLPFHNTRAEALINQLATSCFPSFKVLADTLGGPLTRFARAAIDTELDELTHGVLLRVVVIGFHQIELIIVGARLLAKRRTVLARLQLDDPDALARGPTVLLHHPRLECHGLLETCGKLIGRVVSQCVLQADVHISDLAQRILGTHELHHIRRGPHLNAQLAQPTHAVIKLPLITSVGLDLARIATDDERVELFTNLEELVVLIMDVVNKLTAHAGRDHTIGERDGIIAVAIGALVRATVGGGSHIDSNKRALELRVCRL